MERILPDATIVMESLKCLAIPFFSYIGLILGLEFRFTNEGVQRTGMGVELHHKVTDSVTELLNLRRKK